MKEQARWYIAAAFFTITGVCSLAGLIVAELTPTLDEQLRSVVSRAEKEEPLLGDILSVVEGFRNTHNLLQLSDAMVLGLRIRTNELKYHYFDNGNGTNGAPIPNPDMLK